MFETKDVRKVLAQNQMNYDQEILAEKVDELIDLVQYYRNSLSKGRRSKALADAIVVVTDEIKRIVKPS